MQFPNFATVVCYKKKVLNVSAPINNKLHKATKITRAKLPKKPIY
jgi:hypothetical protein